MRVVTVIFWLVCLSFCSVPLFGATISSGSIQITGIEPTGTFSLSGSTFVATGAFVDGNWGPTHCNPCAENTVLSVDGIEVGNDFGTGSATINGNSFPSVNWGDLNALGYSIFDITGPGIVLNMGAGTYTGTFSFTGSLCGTIDSTGACAADLPTLTGNGQVAVQIGSVVDNGLTLLFYTQATYTFLPTPEPGTLLLLGSGVLGLAGVIRRKISL